MHRKTDVCDYNGVEGENPQPLAVDRCSLPQKQQKEKQVHWLCTSMKVLNHASQFMHLPNQ